MPTSPAVAPPLAVSAADQPTPTTQPPIAPALVWLMAITCGLVVANLYYNQPLLVDIGATFGITESKASLVATATQVGYTLGLLFMVPLGDKLEQKGLIILQLLCAAACLAGVAFAPTFGVMLLASLLTGLFSSVPQLLMPLAAHLANDQERGRVVGTVMSGLLIGVLLSRTISGYVGLHFGWRAMFWAGSAAMVVLSGILYLMLPRHKPSFAGNYGDLLRTLGTLTREFPLLRRSALVGMCMFAGFSAFWTTLVFFLESPAYGYHSDAAGLFGLVGAAGALAAPLAGKSSDKRGAGFALGIGILLFMGAYALLAVGGHYLVVLIIGVVVLDVGQQLTHISNQSRVFALLPEARSRLNTVYMTACFIGASVGSYAGGLAWVSFQWIGVCAVGLAFVVAAYGFNRFYGRVATKAV